MPNKVQRSASKCNRAGTRLSGGMDEEGCCFERCTAAAVQPLVRFAAVGDPSADRHEQGVRDDFCNTLRGSLATACTLLEPSAAAPGLAEEGDDAAFGREWLLVWTERLPAITVTVLFPPPGHASDALIEGVLQPDSGAPEGAAARPCHRIIVIYSVGTFGGGGSAEGSSYNYHLGSQPHQPAGGATVDDLVRAFKGHTLGRSFAAAAAGGITFVTVASFQQIPGAIQQCLAALKAAVASPSLALPPPASGGGSGLYREATRRYRRQAAQYASQLAGHTQGHPLTAAQVEAASLAIQSVHAKIGVMHMFSGDWKAALKDFATAYGAIARCVEALPEESDERLALMGRIRWVCDFIAYKVIWMLTRELGNFSDADDYLRGHISWFVPALTPREGQPRVGDLLCRWKYTWYSAMASLFSTQPSPGRHPPSPRGQPADGSSCRHTGYYAFLAARSAIAMDEGGGQPSALEIVNLLMVAYDAYCVTGMKRMVLYIGHLIAGQYVAIASDGQAREALERLLRGQRPEGWRAIQRALLEALQGISERIGSVPMQMSVLWEVTTLLLLEEGSSPRDAALCKAFPGRLAALSAALLCGGGGAGASQPPQAVVPISVWRGPSMGCMVECAISFAKSQAVVTEGLVVRILVANLMPHMAAAIAAIRVTFCGGDHVAKGLDVDCTGLSAVASGSFVILEEALSARTYGVLLVEHVEITFRDIAVQLNFASPASLICNESLHVPPGVAQQCHAPPLDGDACQLQEGQPPVLMLHRALEPFTDASRAILVTPVTVEASLVLSIEGDVVCGGPPSIVRVAITNRSSHAIRCMGILSVTPDCLRIAAPSASLPYPLDLLVEALSDAEVVLPISLSIDDAPRDDDRDDDGRDSKGTDEGWEDASRAALQVQVEATFAADDGGTWGGERDELSREGILLTASCRVRRRWPLCVTLDVVPYPNEAASAVRASRWRDASDRRGEHAVLPAALDAPLIAHLVYVTVCNQLARPVVIARCQLIAARDAATDAIRDVARDAIRDATKDAVRNATKDATIDAARDAARDAAHPLALLFPHQSLLAGKEESGDICLAPGARYCLLFDDGPFDGAVCGAVAVIFSCEWRYATEPQGWQPYVRPVGALGGEGDGRSILVIARPSTVQTAHVPARHGWIIWNGTGRPAQIIAKVDVGDDYIWMGPKERRLGMAPGECLLLQGVVVALSGGAAMASLCEEQCAGAAAGRRLRLPALTLRSGDGHGAIICESLSHAPILVHGH